MTGGTIISGANAETMYYTAGPSGTVQITLSVTGNGCSGTKSHTAVITSDQTADIHSNSTVCPYGRSAATVMYGGSQSTYIWSITNGTFIGSTAGSNVQFIASGSGAVSLDVSVHNQGGCDGTGHLDIPIVESPLAIETFNSPTCPSQIGNAYAYGSFWGGSYLWTAENATILGRATDASVRYVPDGTGPVTLSVTSTSGDGCTSSATRTIPVGTAAVPQLVASTDPVCPGSTVTVSVANAAEFVDFRWETQNAYPTGNSAPGSVMLEPGPGSTVTATVYARTASGCERSESITIPVGFPDATIAAPVTVCAGSTFKASVPDAGPGYSYDWLVIGGGQLVATNGNEITVLHDGGDIRLRARVYKPGSCDGMETIDIDPAPAMTPGIRFDQPYCGGPSTASVDNAANYATVAWTIQDGAIDGPANGPTVSFHATSGIAPTLTATVTSASGCPTTPGSAQAPMQPGAVPQLVTTPSFCNTGQQWLTAQVTNPEEFSSLVFSVSNGAITAQNGNYVEISNMGAAPTVVMVDAVTLSGCAVTASATIPYVAPPVPVITTTPAQHCGASSVIEATLANASQFTGTGGINWFVRNGYIVSNNGSSVSIQATSAEDVEITVEASTSDNCIGRGSVVVPTGSGSGTPPPIEFQSLDICPNGPGTAYVPPEYSSYSWSIQNGTITGGANNSYVYFTANGAGPVQLSVAVGNPGGGCPVVSTGTLPLRTSTPPVIQFQYPDVCPTGPGTAWTESIWAGYQWSITNGVLNSSPNSSYVYYTANGNGPVTLTLQTWTPENCTATASASQPLRTTTPPVIQFQYPDVCPTGPGTAWTESIWAGYSWSITNGVLNSSPSSSYVYYTANGNGPVTLTLETWTADNCHATASASQPLRTTTPPVIQFQYPDVCPTGPGTAWTESIWAGYSWSITNGVLTSSSNSSYVTYTASGAGPVTLTLQTWTTDNCQASTTASQPLRTTTPPVIQFQYPDVCPTGSGTAWTESVWAGYSWSITNGVLTSSSNSSYVTYTASGTGPVTLSLETWTADNCHVSATASQPLRTVDPPVIQVGPQPDVCPGGTSSAYVPGNYDSYIWSIQRGTITSTSGDQKSVMFTADGTGPVVISVVVSKDSCTSTSSASVPLRSIAPPTLIAGPQPDVCPGGTSSAYVPDNYDSYIWSIQHGVITSTSADQKSVMFTADGTGAVVVSVVVSKDSCTSTSSVTVPLRSIAPPTLIGGPRPDVCPGGTSSAYVPDDYDSYVWSIQHGTITSTSADQKSVMFTADGSGPVVVSVVVSKDSCTSTSSITVPLRTIDPPVLMGGPRPDVCPGGTSSAFVADDYDTYVWSIQNGVITSTSADQKSVMFTADGSGPVVVSVVVSKDSCTSTSSITVPLRAIDPPVITVGPQPDVCPGGTSSAFVADDYDTYVWSIQNGMITSTSGDQKSVMFTADGSGPVVVSLLVSKDSCTSSNSATVPLRTVTPATITPSGPATFCEGGSVTLTANEAAAYQWSTGATTQSITVSAAGSYSVTTIGANGCSSTSEPVQVTVDPAVSATITSAAAICEGSTGTASVPDAGAGASYAWSITNGTIAGGNGTPSITFSASGSAPVQLGVTVTRGTCSASSSKSVAVNPRPVFSILASPYQSYDLRDGDQSMLRAEEESTADATFDMCGVTQVQLRASVLDPTWSYAWSTGATGPILVVSANGTYTLTATNANGCVWTDSATVNMKPMPVATISGAGSICPGGSTTLTAAGGDSYLWSTGATTAAITVSAPGTYSVQVTADGCTASASKMVAQSAAGITADGPTAFCHGGSVTLTANPAQSYLWSNGATTQSITVTASGTFTVQETFDGCTLTSDPVAVSVGPAEVLVAVDDSSACPGQTLHYTSTVTGGTNLTYQWLDGNGTLLGNGTTLDYVPPQPGYNTVFLRVTDANGCELTSDPRVIYRLTPAQPVITPMGPTTFCESGSITLESSPAGYYLWSTGETTRWITVSASGSYTVTTSDYHNCPVTSEPVTVTVLPRPPQPVITASGPLTFCQGGSVTLTGPDGYAHYAWSTGESTQSITVSTSRNVTLTVVNEAGCTNTSDVQVTVNPVPPASIAAGGPTTFCEGGSVTLTAPAGYAYAWSTGAITQSIVVSQSGPYSVTVTNASGCSATSAATNVTVNAKPATPVIAESGPTTFCEGGSVTLTAPAGFSYLWSTGAITQSITVSQPGPYSVTVTNASGCSATSAATNVTVNAKPATPVINESGSTTFCEGGSVTLTAPAGFSYLWSTGANTQSIVVSQSGPYSVTVTNASGCSATSATTNVTVNAKPATPVIAESGSTTFCEGGSVTLTAPAGFSYLWSTGASTQSIVVSQAGPYSVTVTNASGCSATSAATNVTVNAKPATPVIAESGSTTFCEGGSVTLTAPAGFSYLWSTGASTQSIVVSQSGPYSVTVTNASGCSATSAATNVTVNAKPATPVIAESGSTTFCEGGSVTLTAPAGYSYLWSTGAITQSIIVSQAGPYSVTVTNAAGCSATSATTNVTVNAKPATPVITPSGPTTFCAGGSVTLTAPAGYSYLWSTGAITQSIIVSQAGPYSVTVTNAAGCSATSATTNVTVNAKPPTPVITPSGSTALCPGASVTLTATAGYTYLWSTGAITQSINVSTPGPYSVTVTNASGCSTASATTTVTSNPATSITTQPQSATIPRNVSRVLSVAATGTAPLMYQWYEGNSGDTTKAMAGQTTSSVTVGGFSKKGTYRFWVRVWSATCPSSTVNSATAVITVN